MAMLSAGCLWNRPRLERHVDGALGPRQVRAVETHLARCVDCLARVERLTHLRSLVHSAFAEPPEPDWAGFWPGIKTRIARETARPITDSWWLPLWKPFWGHPRFTLGGAMAAALVLAFSLWPGGEGHMPAAWAEPVVVQDVGTTDPDRSVMVYSTPDHALTVIWLFSHEDTSDES